jgi:hypothetical protein
LKGHSRLRNQGHLSEIYDRIEDIFQKSTITSKAISCIQLIISKTIVINLTCYYLSITSEFPQAPTVDLLDVSALSG